MKKGTEQTPLNYWLQINDIDVNLELPLSYKLTHMHRRDLLGYNWQLNEDTTPFFIKYGYVWVFSGFSKEHRNIGTSTLQFHYSENALLLRRWAARLLR